MLVNAYNAKVTSGGNTLVDMVGSNNGTFGGATLPVIHQNGYIKFTGGHHSTNGNWGRIDLASSFQHTAAHNFSTLVEWKSTTTNYTVYNTIWMDVDNSAGSNVYVGNMTISSALRGYMRSVGAVLSFMADSTIPFTKWQTAVITNSQANRNIGFNTVLTNNTLNSTGNLYTANSTNVIGARNYGGGNYQYDATMYFSKLLHFNHKLSNAEISQYNNQLQGVI